VAFYFPHKGTGTPKPFSSSKKDKSYLKMEEREERKIGVSSSKRKGAASSLRRNPLIFLVPEERIELS